MKQMLILSIICFLSLVCLSFASELSSEDSSKDRVKTKIASVIDGDTVRILKDQSLSQITRVRLYGIDAPESKQKFGRSSERGLKGLLRPTSHTYIEFLGKDRYGREIGIIYTQDPQTNEWRNINELMVKYGYAWVYSDYCTKDVCSTWKKYELTARERRAGL